MKLTLTLTLTLACLVLVSCDRQKANVPINADARIEDAWIRAAPPAARMLAAYMRVTNPGPVDIRIVGADCSGFKKTEIHRTEIVGDIATMSRQESVNVSAGGTVSFEPGGLHLMLHNPTSPLESGAEVECTLDLESGDRLTARVRVRESGNETADHEAHHHQDE